MGLISNFEFGPVFERARAGIDMAELQARAKAALPHAWPFLKEISDPRGRCNRQGFLVIAVTFLVLQALVAGVFALMGVQPSFELTCLLNAPVIWIGTTIGYKRLHDVGLSGWWLPGAFAMWGASALLTTTIVFLIFGDEALATGEPGYFAVLAAVMLPLFGALLWLHTAPSVAEANRFGPVPGGNGLSMPQRMAA